MDFATFSARKPGHALRAQIFWSNNRRCSRMKTKTMMNKKARCLRQVHYMLFLVLHLHAHMFFFFGFQFHLSAPLTFAKQLRWQINVYSLRRKLWVVAPHRLRDLDAHLLFYHHRSGLVCNVPRSMKTRDKNKPRLRLVRDLIILLIVFDAAAYSYIFALPCKVCACGSTSKDLPKAAPCGSRGAFS